MKTYYTIEFESGDLETKYYDNEKDALEEAKESYKEICFDEGDLLNIKSVMQTILTDDDELVIELERENFQYDFENDLIEFREECDEWDRHFEEVRSDYLSNLI